MPPMTITLFKGAGSGHKDPIKAAIDTVKASQQTSALGLQLQDQSTLQLTSESTSDSPLSHSLKSSLGRPSETYTIDLNTSAFAPDGAATAPLTEVVTNFFPAARVTPEKQQQIESDFQAFDRIIRTVANGDLGLSCGWAVDEVEREDVEGGKARPFFILRGWRSMEDFERLTAQEVFKTVAIPILMNWGVQFKMVSRRRLLAGRPSSCTLTERSGMSSARLDEITESVLSRLRRRRCLSSLDIAGFDGRRKA